MVIGNDSNVTGMRGYLEFSTGMNVSEKSLACFKQAFYTSKYIDLEILRNTYNRFELA